MKKLLSMVILFIGLTSASQCSLNAYVLEYPPRGAAYLVKLNTSTDAIEKKIEIPRDAGFNNISIDENGDCYINCFREPIMFLKDIYFYDDRRDSTKHFKHFEGYFGPKFLYDIGDRLMFTYRGHSEHRGKGGILFIDKKSGDIVGDVYPRGNDTRYNGTEMCNLYYDGGKYAFASTIYYGEGDASDEEYSLTKAYGDVVVINVEKMEVEKYIKVPRKYSGLNDSFCIGDKIYVSATIRNLFPSFQDRKINDELLVFSLSSGKLVKTIKVLEDPAELAYDRSVNKLFVMHRNASKIGDWIEVIDPTTDIILDRINIKAVLDAQVVAPGKLYVTVGSSYMNKVNEKPRLIVIDTRSNRVIKEFVGSYQGISTNLNF